jgi:hypothetical protein
MLVLGFVGWSVYHLPEVIVRRLGDDLAMAVGANEVESDLIIHLNRTEWFWAFRISAVWTAEVWNKPDVAIHLVSPVVKEQASLTTWWSH